MRSSIALRQQLNQSISDEIAARKQIHQARIARLRTASAARAAGGTPPATGSLVILAQGDSWFDYPLSGNDVSFGNTDVIAQLQSMGNINPAILSIAHFGEATTDEPSLPKQEQMIESLQDPSNWPASGKPDAILISGGGNDIAGNQFCIFLDYASNAGSTGLNATRLQKALGTVEASYLDLFAFRDRYATGFPIFGHCYDFPVPNGVHPVCAGPWLKPSLDYAGWNVTQGTAIIRQALVDLKARLQALADAPSNNFTLVDTRGVLAIDDWANELYPFPGGFKKIAAKFITALSNKFPGRI